MFSLGGLLIGSGLIIIGVVTVKYTFQAVNLTGRQMWIEKYAGSGSTYGVYKIFGVILVLVGILTATGFGDNVMNFLLTPLYNLFAPLRGVK
jgi:hypothetical protein